MNTMNTMMELSSIAAHALPDFQSILHGFPLIPIVIGFWLLVASNPSVRARESGRRDGQ